MVLTRENHLKYISKNLAILQQDIKNRKESNLQDLAILSENFIRDLLNIVFDYRLENLNAIKLNQSAIDLGDSQNRVAVQVTSTSGRSKVTETIQKFIDHKLYEEYSDLYIFILTKKQKNYKKFDTKGCFNFDWRKNIIDFSDLFNKISHLETKKLEKIHDFIEGEISGTSNKSKIDWVKHPDATYLALILLIGAWDDSNNSDIQIITQLLKIDYDTWLQKARDILYSPDSPLSLKDSIWKITSKGERWKLLGSRILDRDLDTFKSIAVSVLKEPDPAFELPADERYAASIHGKVLEHSYVLRESIAEGLAILGSQLDVCKNCSPGKVEITCILAIREIFIFANWTIWGSLNDLLPTLAEAAPDEFLKAVEKVLLLEPCPFDQLFAQEGNSITGRNYLTGLLWALEGLAWDEQYLVRVCVVLGELVSHDPGGQWANRPVNSLVGILLPWLPQTLASVNKRRVAVQNLLKECPDVGWNLIIKLLPNQHQTSFSLYKPKWRKIIPDSCKNTITHQEYWQEVSFYTDLAIREVKANYDTRRIIKLIDHFDNLPKSAFDQLIEILSSQTTDELPEEQKLLLWDHLTKFTNKHRRFSDAKWALSDEILTRIENISEQLAPTNPFNKYQYLFTDRDFELYDKNDNSSLEERQKKLSKSRDTAIHEVFEQNGIQGIIQFAETVISAVNVGYALGSIQDDTIEQALFPQFLGTANKKYQDLISGFIWRRYQINGWEWCDKIDKSEWSLIQIGNFLSCLPFIKETWNRVYQWMGENQEEYWCHTGVNILQADSDLAIAIDKLIEHGRPLSAINCLDRMLRAKQPINPNQCIQALLSALSFSEPAHTMSSYDIVELIKFLQTEPSVTEQDLFQVEFAYLPLLNDSMGAEPKHLERGLARDPELFCQILQLIYRSDKENQPLKEPSKSSKVLATNAWQLLEDWKTPPGLQEDKTFNVEHFTEWLQQVKIRCTESGHLGVALSHIGQVLIYAPSDPDGLWIHQAIASALNDRDAEDMRAGFRTGTFNLRECYSVDPTGAPEKELVQQFQTKAENLENASFHRFAITLKELSDGYKYEAERIINKYKDQDDDA